MQRLLFFNLIHLVAIFELSAHPVPDLPVRAYFSEDGAVEFRVEIDPRCYEPDPEAVEYYLKSQVDAMDGANVQAMKDKVELYLSQRMQFLFEPDGITKPDLKWEFRKLGDNEWTEPEAESVLVGSWKIRRDGKKVYRLKALALTQDSMGIPMNVVFLNFLNQVKEERYAVLFPGETSFAFDWEHAFNKESEEPPEEVAVAIVTTERKRKGFIIPAAILIVIAGIWWLIKRNSPA